MDVTLNGISFLDSKGKRSNASSLVDKFNAHFTQNYCVQPLPQTDRLFKEGGALRQSKVISGSNFLLSHVEQRDSMNVGDTTGGDVAGSQKLSPTAICAKFSILDLQLLLKIIEHVSDDFGNEIVI